MTTKINARPVEAFEVTDEQGKPLAVLRVTDRWEGLARLATDDGQSLIVDEPSTYAAHFGQAFARIFGGDRRGTYSLQVVKATPELAAKLGLLAPREVNTGGPTA